jgi:hypothetical protein
MQRYNQYNEFVKMEKLNKRIHDTYRRIQTLSALRAFWSREVRENGCADKPRQELAITQAKLNQAREKLVTLIIKIWKNMRSSKVR